MVELEIDNQFLRGILYFPLDKFKKPLPIIIIFHGFPQLLTLNEIARIYQYLLEEGYIILVFNFRGYSDSDGEISISNQVNDAIKIIEFIEIMVKRGLILKDEINILSHDFGGYIALILCSKIKNINQLLIINPILNINQYIEKREFKRSIEYINHYLPGYVKGIEDIERFMKKIIEELNQDQYNIEHFLKNINYRDIKIIIDENINLTSLNEIQHYFNSKLNNINVIKIKNLDLEFFDGDISGKLKEEVLAFFTRAN
jgi:alpha/beta superfamily hydrolase